MLAVSDDSTVFAWTVGFKGLQKNSEKLTIALSISLANSLVAAGGVWTIDSSNPHCSPTVSGSFWIPKRSSFPENSGTSEGACYHLGNSLGWVSIASVPARG